MHSHIAATVLSLAWIYVKEKAHPTLLCYANGESIMEKG